MKALINLTGDRQNWLAHEKKLALVIKHVLEMNTELNQAYIQFHRVPYLYASGVRYQEEPLNLLTMGGKPFENIEDFALIPAVIERGWGDCDDLAPWRCAELRNAGEHAKIRIEWKTHPVTRQRVYHVLVRRENGDIEDPSLKLGMPG